MTDMGDLELADDAEEIGLRICKNCFRIKSHTAYKGSGRVCRACKGTKLEAGL
jgi:hypothetical protein